MKRCVTLPILVHVIVNSLSDCIDKNIAMIENIVWKIIHDIRTKIIVFNVLIHTGDSIFRLKNKVYLISILKRY